MNAKTLIIVLFMFLLFYCMIKKKSCKKGKFSSISIFDPKQDTPGVYISDDIEPVILTLDK